jgi:hypothetical protein
MQFGAFVPQGWRMDLVGVPLEEQWPTMRDVGNRMEALGYDSLWVYDHFHTVPDPTQESTFEAWTLMASFAVATDRVRLGQMCTCNSYRPPSYLAKVASTVDVMSGGRLEFAIGAGWYEEEYLAYGYDFPKGRRASASSTRRCRSSRRCGRRTRRRSRASTTGSTAPSTTPEADPAAASPDLDRRRRRAADPARGRRARRLLQLRRQHGDLPGEGRDPRPPLRRNRPGSGVDRSHHASDPRRGERRGVTEAKLERAAAQGGRPVDKPT